MPSFPVATPLRTILPAIQAQLVLVTGITSNRVLLVARDQVPTFQGDQDILVRVGPPSPVAGFTQGAGRVAPVVSRILQVTPRTRWAVDQSDRDDSWLTDPVFGHTRLEELVADALHIWFPGDQAGNYYTQEPIRWVQSAPPVKRTDPDIGWGSTDLQFEMKYILPLSNNGF